MLLCPTCGNEVDAGAVKCEYCDTGLRNEALTFNQPIDIHRIINIEYGRPIVEVALKRLHIELSLAKDQKVKVLTLIHGYGSSGKGGKIRIECRKVLDQLVRKKEIIRFVAGENFRKRIGAGKSLLRRFPTLEKECASDFNNPGVTIVELK